MAQRIEQFEDIIAWQKAKLLTIGIYSHTKNIKDYSFANQMQRAAVSVMNNIAEGFERKSNKEFKQFLFIAKGSCGEVRSMIYLGSELGYFKTEQASESSELTLEIARIISGLIKKL